MPMTEFEYTPPTLAAMRETHARLAPYTERTPVADWTGRRIAAYLGADARVVLKLELFQRTGTFKARGAVNRLLLADRPAGVTAVSAGNHAIASAYAASVVGADAKVVMLASANPARIAAAEAFGADVLIEPDGPTAFARAHTLEETEGRFFIHPFEGPPVTLATAGVSLELFEDAGALDAIVVAVGGGGLSSGVASAAKLLHPNCAVYGVEPEGANVMRRSIEAGAPQTLEKVETIADSLAPPMTTPYAFETCRRNFDDVVLVSDDEMTAGIAMLFADMKLAVEPAAAAAVAGAFGPLRERLSGKRVGLIICGSNIDSGGFCKLLHRGERAIADGVLPPA